MFDDYFIYYIAKNLYVNIFNELMLLVIFFKIK